MKMHRRAFLQTASLTTVGLTGLSAIAQAKVQKRNCILIVLTGGPSQLDTWDPKPNAPEYIRGPFQSIATKTPGVRFTELFSRMAANSDLFQVVRSVHHTAAPIHETGLQLLQTGGLSEANESRNHLLQDGLLLPEPIGFTGVNLDRGQTNLRTTYLDIDQESSRDRFGRSPFGDDCLRACRLVEQGHRGVVLNMFSSVYDSLSWDCHAAGPTLPTKLSDYRTIGNMFDVAYTSLLTELKERGLLEETLVIAAGEFGRTPKVNSQGGRDHWAGVWSVLLAGGGIPGGSVVGSSDTFGAEPNSEPILLENLHQQIARRVF